ncbi:hypothetical protein Tco_0136488, partial [Tanacetum coccineum]
LKKQKKDDEDEQLLSIFKQIHINLPFLEAMIHIVGNKSSYDLILPTVLKGLVLPAQVKADDMKIRRYGEHFGIFRYHSLKMKPKSIAQARRNMIKYLKNQGNFKMTDFKGMSYNEVRPIFEKLWDFNQKFVPLDAECWEF